MPDNHEYTGAVFRAITYIIGICLGLGAKLSLLNKKSTLTVKDFNISWIYCLCCAWLVWSILSYMGN
jgi:hypothetical protein